MTKLATCHTGTEAVIADTDRFVLESIGEVVLPFCHGTNKDAYALSGPNGLDVISYFHYFGIKAEGDFAAVWWEVVSDGILDDFEEFFL